jgi:hypothetical protein
VQARKVRKIYCDATHRGHAQDNQGDSIPVVVGGRNLDPMEPGRNRPLATNKKFRLRAVASPHGEHESRSGLSPIGHVRWPSASARRTPCVGFTADFFHALDRRKHRQSRCIPGAHQDCLRNASRRCEEQAVVIAPYAPVSAIHDERSATC